MPSPYRFLFDNLLTKVDPERAHHGAATLFRILGRTPVLRDAVRATLGRAPAGHAPELFGRPTTGLLGLAAGFDKDATMAAGLDAVGFGFIEIGTVTAHAQPGNDKPRLFRIPERKALVNRMGFNNSGAAEAATRLRKLRKTAHGRRLVLGANIGKSKITPAADAVQDYRTSARLLAPYVDYIVVNVSSPNTPGLRDLQQTEALRPILVAVLETARAAAARELPVLVKIAPDLADSDVDAVADLAREIGLAGVVAVNTTIKHELGAGGMSGPPVRERGIEVVARVRARLAEDQVIIGVGGISTPADARAYLTAGANALQAYTSFIYGGATWPGAINRALGAG